MKKQKEEKINVMVNGLPGKMAKEVVRSVLKDKRMKLIQNSLTGPEITSKGMLLTYSENADPGALKIELIKPDYKYLFMADPGYIMVDFTQPDAVNENAEFYCEKNCYFIMGTTGGDRAKLADTVAKSKVSAVIAPNMCKEVVAFQAMMEYAAENFPNLYSEFLLSVKESHQFGKKDTSGTAKAMVYYFQQLGITNFSEAHIEKIRDPRIQKAGLKVPENFLGGHGWHTYSLMHANESLFFSFTHNVNGRLPYALGTLDAIAYLAKKREQGIKGQVFTMMDVLRNA